MIVMTLAYASAFALAPACAIAINQERTTT